MTMGGKGKAIPVTGRGRPWGCETSRLSQGHSAAGRIRSIENTNDLIGNRTRDLPACCAVPLQRAPPSTNADPLKFLCSESP
jgi:hypothetical protein